ncbi:hypothetical protein B0T21DRAFT_164687 [Apiosordaria backusii]|uniref:Transmembrane protein n=1 Tax=Apiosordaria backusii TaxID=314023 RepID=A0AA40EGD8_9PEZI|nr:hypothetical protein B0T21DRAFT_164687 [Apiosordaria backusii]
MGRHLLLPITARVMYWTIADYYKTKGKRKKNDGENHRRGETRMSTVVGGSTEKRGRRMEWRMKSRFYMVTLASWVWLHGFGFMGLASWVWLHGFGFMGLASWVWLDGFAVWEISDHEMYVGDHTS